MRKRRRKSTPQDAFRFILPTSLTRFFIAVSFPLGAPHRETFSRRLCAHDYFCDVYLCPREMMRPWLSERERERKGNHVLSPFFSLSCSLPDANSRSLRWLPERAIIPYGTMHKSEMYLQRKILNPSLQKFRYLHFKLDQTKINRSNIPDISEKKKPTGSSFLFMNMFFFLFCSIVRDSSLLFSPAHTRAHTDRPIYLCSIPLLTLR